MNNRKANLWLFKKKAKDITFSYEIKQKGRFIKGSLIAIICGLIIGGIIIAAQNVNPFEYLKYLFTIGFSHLFTDQTIQWLCIYIVAALAVAVGFKAGMFNIGVSGQMVMGSGVAIIFYKLAVKTPANMNAGYIIVMFLICAFSGALMAGLAGLLKALFNIHEVVTTIMLNWTAWYLMKYLFGTFQNIAGLGIQSSASIPSNSLTINGSSIAIPIIIAGIAVIIVAVVLAKTVFGYKIKAVGASPDASKYAGFNVKQKMIDAMLISGFLAGIAAFVNIFTITPNITFAHDNLPQIGYDSIAITLVAFNNPIGILFSSFLWAVLQSAGSSAASLFNLPTEMSQLIFGVIVYFAAISVVFINWYPIIKLRIMIALTSSKASQVKIKNLRKQILKYHKDLMNINSVKDVQDYKSFIKGQIAEQQKLLSDSSKTKEDKLEIKKAIANLKENMNLYVKEYRKNLKEQIKKAGEQIKQIKKENYISRINSAKEGINRREWNAIKKIEEDALSKTSLIKSDILSLKDNYKKDLKTKKHWLRDQLKALKTEYKLKLTQNAVWCESETGIKNHFWEMKNGKIEAKANINKIKINSHNEILNIKSDAQMAKMDLKSQYKNDEETLKQKEQDLISQMKEDIASVKQKEQVDIKVQKDWVAQLVSTYKETRKVNLADQKKILADKYGVEIKKKEIAEILNVWDNNLATLVDIKLATELKNTYVDSWYYQEQTKIFEQAAELSNKQDWTESHDAYVIVKQALDEFKQSVKELGFDNTTEIIKKKKTLLNKLIKQIKQVWTSEYSDVDNNYWTKKRFNIYTYIDNEQAKLNKLGIVIKAEEEISEIKAKAKYIRKMYNLNIKQFKQQYDQNKKLDAIGAQQNYHAQIEKFINKLERSSFKKLQKLSVEGEA